MCELTIGVASVNMSRTILGVKQPKQQIIFTQCLDCVDNFQMKCCSKSVERHCRQVRSCSMLSC